MRCPICRTENTGSTNICPSCGSPLKAAISPRKKKISWIAIVPGVLLFIAGLLLINWFIKSGDIKKSADESRIQAEPKEELSTRAESSPKHTAGIVIIQNTKEEVIAQIKSAVINANWIAIPTCAGLGGKRWIFRSSQLKDDALVETGIWSSGNPAGLWRIGQEREYDSFQLASWDRGDSLEWHSLDMTRTIERAVVASPKKEGHFTSVSVPREMKEPGIFVQNDRVVGWTFGIWMEKGLLWDEPGEINLDHATTVSDLVNVANLNWQEAQFIKGLAREKDSSPLERFRFLANGFLSRPQFPPELKPRYLHPRSIVPHLNSLASQLMQTGLSKEVVDILSDQVLQEASDPGILKIATLARVKFYDHWKAARYFERMKKSLINKGIRFGSELDGFHAKLYKDWIRISLEKGEIQSGRMAYETGKRLFPEDAELHILGIQQAVSEKNWEEARQLLLMRSFPENLQAKAKHLEQLITEKLDTKKTVCLRFTPGAKEIVVEALLNQGVKQYFILDTGATHVTISPKTADQLGIVVTENTPVRPIRTASNVILAYEVTLDSIAIGNLKADNIIALIIDLPGVPGAGLLGTNFLNHFNVEIDNRNGVLILTAR